MSKKLNEYGNKFTKKEIKLLKKFPNLFGVKWISTPDYRIVNGTPLGTMRIDAVTWSIIAGKPRDNAGLNQELNWLEEKIPTTFLKSIVKDTEAELIIVTDSNGKETTFNYGSGGGTGNAIWGEIQGTLDDQADLRVALESKANQSTLDEAVSRFTTAIVDEADARNRADTDLYEVKADKSDTYTKAEVDERISSESASFLGLFLEEGTRPESFDYDSYIKQHLTSTPTNNDYVLIGWKESGEYDRCKYNASTTTWLFEFTITGDVSGLSAKLEALTTRVTNLETTLSNSYLTSEECFNTFFLETAGVELDNRLHDAESTISTQSAQISDLSTQVNGKVNVITAPETTQLTEEIKSKITGGCFVNGTFLGLTNPMFYPSTDAEEGIIYGLVAGKSGNNTTFHVYQIDGNNVISVAKTTRLSFTSAGNVVINNPFLNGTIRANNNRIQEVATPTADTDAVNLQYFNEHLPSVKPTMVSTTYAELKTLRDVGTLVAGTWYRITDYVATTTQENTQATTNQYDIIVLATSTNTLSEEARAIQHSGDTYFANSNLNDWKVWYCLDNDTNRFAWADSTNGKGVVYHLIDEFDNDVWYDFKCIQVKNTNLTDRFYYLFDNEGVDASMSSSTAFPSVYGNKLGFYVSSNKFQIGCNVFKGSSFRNNTIGNNFNSNTIGNNFHSNTIGNNFHSNTIGNHFNSNTIGNSFHSNTIGNYFNSNTIGNNFNSNTIGNNFHSNTIGNNFHSNTIGDSFFINTIGNDFYYNTIGNSFFINTIGNSFDNNNTTSQTSQPLYCSFPDGVENKITTSTTLTRTSKTTFYLGSDGTLKPLD